MGIPGTPASPLPALPAPCSVRAALWERISRQGTERDEINSLPRFTPLEGKATCRAQSGYGSSGASLRRGSRVVLL